MDPRDQRANERLLDAFYREPTDATFLPLYEHTKDLVYTLCRRILASEEDATDALQATYCRLLAAARRGASETGLDDARATVYRLAVREAQNLRQRRQRRFNREVNMQIEGLPNSQSRPDQEAAVRQDRERVEALVSTLSERYRLPVLLHYFHGLTYAEIATALDVPQGTISSRIGRALRKLKPMLRRAGLAESTAILGGVAATSSLFAPPARLDASTVFATAEKTLASGGAAVALSSSGAKVATAAAETSSVLTSLAVGLAKTKTAVVAATLAVAAIAMITVAIVQSANDSEEFQATAVSPEDGEDTAASEPLPGSAGLPPSDGAVKVSDEPAATSLFGSVWIADLNQPAGGAEVYVPGTDISVIADAEGRFTIDRIDATEIKLAAKSGRYRTHATGEWSSVQPVELQPQVANGPHRILLQRVPVFTGVVRDLETGEPIAGAEVKASFRHTALTDASGTYFLPGVIGPGETEPISLTATAEDYVLVLVQTERSGHDDITRNFELEPGAEVLVRVVDDRGEPVQGARIGTVVGFRLLPTEVTTDAAGQATVGGISRTNPQELFAKKDGYTGGRDVRPRFDDEHSVAEVTLVLRRYEPEVGYYAGRITNSDDEPLVDMEVRVQYADKTNLLRRCAPVETDADGYYRVALENPKSGFLIVAGGGGYAPQSRTGIRPGSLDEPTEIDFALEPGHWLEGVVVDENETPLTEVEIQANGVDDEENAFILFGKNGFVRTNRDGRFRIEGAPSSGVRLNLKVQGRASLWKSLDVDQDVRIVMPHPAIIRGRVVDGATGKPVSDFTVKHAELRNSHGLNRRSGRAVHAGDGRFIIDDDLKVGREYVVRVETAHYLAAVTDAIVAHPEGKAEEIVIALTTGDALSGTVVAAETAVPISGATVVYGFKNAALRWGDLDSSGVYEMLDDVERTVTGRDGEFQFVEGERRGTVYIKAPGFVPARVEPNERQKYARENGEIVARLEPGGSIAGTFFIDGAPRADATVSAWDGWVDFGPIVTDSQGRFRLGGLPAGQHKFEAFVNEPRYSVTRKVNLPDRQEKVVNIGDDLGLLSVSGQVLHGDLAPAERAGITVEPQFEWDYTEFEVGTDEEGRYRVRGLIPGRYWIRAWSAVKGGGSRHLRRSVDLRGDAVEDFVLHGDRQVFAQLAFPSGSSDGMVARVRTVRLTAIDAAGDSGAQELGAIDRQASARVDDGSVRFEGRFKGAYRVDVEFYQRDVGEATVTLPERALLDNLEGDQDLGDLVLPDVGWIDLSLVNTSGVGTLPEHSWLVLVPEGRERNAESATYLNLRPPKPTASIGPIQAGSYVWAANVWGFQCAPVWSTVNVRAGGSTPLQVDLQPEGLLHFVVQIGLGTVPFNQVTLAGPALAGEGGTRILEPDRPIENARFLSTGDYSDRIGGASFTFHNLPPGDYDITVEVEGYETWRARRTVVLGEGRREDIRLRMATE